VVVAVVMMMMMRSHPLVFLSGAIRTSASGLIVIESIFIGNVVNGTYSAYGGAIWTSGPRWNSVIR
jgi:hypothetical protein